MKTKRIILVAVLALGLLVLLFAALPVFMQPENSFPLNKAVIEQTFAKQGLQWTLGEYNSFGEGQGVYMVHNENGKITATINSMVKGGGKMLDLSLIRPSPLETALTEAVEQEDWKKMFALACGLYGGSLNADKAFQQMSAYLQTQQYEPQDRVIVWKQKAGSVCYEVQLQPSLKYYGRFDLRSIKLFNQFGYQAYQSEVDKISSERAEREKSKGVVQNSAAITVTSTADVNLVWSPENQEISQQFAALLLAKDEELDKYTKLDIAPNNLTVCILQDGQQENYSLWLWFDEESRAIVQNQEMIQDGTDKFGNPTGYHPTWYISAEKSNQLREMLKELA